MAMQKHILFIAVLLCSTFLFAQNETGHPILDDYNVIEVSGKVYIDVTISSGNTCKGIDVQRSDDSLNFVQVGHVGGICGNSSKSVSYSFVDEYPIKNKKSYYRVLLGERGYTTVTSITIIDTEEFGFQVRPNPANERATIFFENPYNDEFQLELFNLSGKKMLQLSSSSNAFDLNTFNLQNGLYFFSISKALDQKKVIGKLVVQH